MLRLLAAALATNLLLVNVLFLSLVSAALYAARDRGVFSALLPLAALKICLPLQLGSDYFAPQSSSRWKLAGAMAGCLVGGAGSHAVDLLLACTVLFASSWVTAAVALGGVL
ncbi:hypothetical protein TeGR_g10368 [Tetraparma gracilis]|uniref:Uncharacterized protein n=1 Tax=Tetraparma gracilis TaxID=2962635 RepID=A0ABQ6MQZ0_9STRA|nr:hypothetical protein TeGR_g10368 [Tetraparma gracilis]